MTATREDLVAQQVLAAVRREPGRYRPNALIRELGLRRADCLHAIRRLEDRKEIYKDRDGRLVPAAVRGMPIAGRVVAGEPDHGAS